MRTMKAYTGIVPALLLVSALAVAAPSDDFSLEPSINGGVSASGLFASQAEEDRYLAELSIENLEPCINGGVSANGLFASQAEQDDYFVRLAGG